jgi:hypothetical protein
MSWCAFKNGNSIGQTGSEGGIIVRDEEHIGGARITLERDGHAPYAITCGIYDWMVHTRFFDAESKAQTEYESMRAELDRIIAAIPLAADQDVRAKVGAVSRSLEEFIRQFPTVV